MAYLSEHAGPWPAWVERVKQAFTSEETEILLGDPRLSGPGGKAVRVKLQRLGLPGYEAVMGRNLRALIEASRGEEG